MPWCSAAVVCALQVESGGEECYGGRGAGREGCLPPARFTVVISFQWYALQNILPVALVKGRGIREVWVRYEGGGRQVSREAAGARCRQYRPSSPRHSFRP